MLQHEQFLRKKQKKFKKFNTYTNKTSKIISKKHWIKFHISLFSRYLNKKMKLEKLFPVQKQVIPIILDSNGGQSIYPNDICVTAPTGSGKTLTYVLPIIQNLKNRIKPCCRAIVQWCSCQAKRPSSKSKLCSLINSIQSAWLTL